MREKFHTVPILIAKDLKLTGASHPGRKIKFLIVFHT